MNWQLYENPVISWFYYVSCPTKCCQFIFNRNWYLFWHSYTYKYKYFCIILKKINIYRRFVSWNKLRINIIFKFKYKESKIYKYDKPVTLSKYHNKMLCPASVDIFAWWGKVLSGPYKSCLTCEFYVPPRHILNYKPKFIGAVTSS